MAVLAFSVHQLSSPALSLWQSLGMLNALQLGWCFCELIFILFKVQHIFSPIFFVFSHSFFSLFLFPSIFFLSKHCRCCYCSIAVLLLSLSSMNCHCHQCFAFVFNTCHCLCMWMLLLPCAPFGFILSFLSEFSSSSSALCFCCHRYSHCCWIFFHVRYFSFIEGIEKQWQIHERSS